VSESRRDAGHAGGVPDAADADAAQGAQAGAADGADNRGYGSPAAVDWHKGAGGRGARHRAAPISRWVDGRSDLAVTLWGSRRCPPVAARAFADEARSEVTVVVRGYPNEMCTADAAPATTVIHLPEDVRLPRSAHVVVKRPGSTDIVVTL
jgi:hypothetical protein